MALRSVDQIKAAFDAEGATYCAWAAEHGFRPQNVYAVLSGRAKGRRGEAHRIAIALGLKSARQAAAIDEVSVGRRGAEYSVEPPSDSRAAHQPAQKELPMS